MHAIDLTLNDSVHTVNNCAIEPRPCPTFFFLLNNPLHSYVHHNLEEKMLLLPLHYDFKRKVHTKWNFCHRLLTLISFQTCTFTFFCGTQKKLFWRMLVAKHFQFPLMSIVWKTNTNHWKTESRNRFLGIKNLLLCSAEERNAYRLDQYDIESFLHGLSL